MAGYALPQFQFPGNATLDFSPITQGLNVLGQTWTHNRKTDQFKNALAQAQGVVDPRLMALAEAQGYEQGPNALMQAYAQQEQRALMQRHHDAQIAQSKAAQAHQQAVLAETQRFHNMTDQRERERTRLMDDRVRQRYGLDESGNALSPAAMSGMPEIGADSNGGFYIKASSPAPAPRRASPPAISQGGGPLPIDRVDTESRFLPTDSGIPGISVAPLGMHPGAKALARQEAQQILDTTDVQRLDARNPQHSLIIQKLGDAYGGGKLDKGKRWSLDENHRLVQEDIPGATKLTANERKGEAMAQMGLQALEQAERQLVGKVEKKNGEYVSSGTPGIPAWKQVIQSPISVPGLGQVSEGFGDTLRAQKSARSAVTALNFYMSGAGVSNKEREHFLDLYMPKTTDSRETQAWKIGRLKDYFKIVRTVRDGVNGSASDQVRAATLGMIEEGAAPQQQAAPAPKASGPAPGRYRYDPATGEMKAY